MSEGKKGKGKELTCGNATCACGKSCGCPFGACSCNAEEEEEATIVEDEEEQEVAGLDIGEVDLESKETVLNINIGVLGHVNSGKTSLVRALSRTLSTAALDKNPQSKERGMTLDLGFSSFATQAPSQFVGIDKLQYTLVDCPGHASLIKTIIGGAQIIDRMILVIDVTKGMQAQTAECLVIGEILTEDLIVVLNKVDLIPTEKRAEGIELAMKTMSKVLSNTVFASAPMVAIAAFVDGGDENPHPTGSSNEPPLQTHNLIELVRLIKETTKMPKRDYIKDPLYFSVDHCFPIKGQGTVLTGTMMAGTASIGDEIEIPDLGVTRKIKSIQRFRRSVASVSQGDRASFAISNVDSKKIERCVVCTPKTVPTTNRVVALIRKVKYFEKQCASGSKLHVTIGPNTGIAKVTFFGRFHKNTHKRTGLLTKVIGSTQLKEIAKANLGKKIPLDSQSILMPDKVAKDWEYDAELKTGGKLLGGPVLQFALLEFENSVVVPKYVQLIGSRLDLNDSNGGNSCRIAIYGRVSVVIPDNSNIGDFVKLYKNKQKTGVVDRVDRQKGASVDVKVDQIIGRGLFKKDTDISIFLGLKLIVQKKNKNASSESEEFLDEETGVIDSTFGKTGKFKVYFQNGTTAAVGDRLLLKFKKYVVGNDKKEIVQ